MANFLHYIKGANAENIEFYIGKGSGNKITKDLRNASKEIIIISPYVSEGKIDLLLDSKERGVGIKLAFSSLNEKQAYSTLQKLIKREEVIDEHLKNDIEININKLKTKTYINTIINVLIFLIGNYLFTFSILNSDFFFLQKTFSILVLLIFLFFNKRINKERNKLFETKIIKFNYKKYIDFTYLNNNFRNDKMFVHSKIYIIDDSIAYLGSVNFTYNGFKENLETRIRITDKVTIRKLKQFANELFEENDTSSHKLDWLGKKFFNVNEKELTYKSYLYKKM